eukprot:Skav220103  [mRNA]  locus=scaffold5950:9114:9893:+ [translate_table: standard]
MDELKLKVPEEPDWRSLECRLLQPEEDHECQPLSEEELANLFDVSSQQPAAGDDAEAEVESEEETEPNNDMAMEAVNMAPDMPADQGDGAEIPEAGEDDMAQGMSDFMVSEMMINHPGHIPEGLQPGEDPVFLVAEDYSDDEELSFSPGFAKNPRAEVHIPNEETVVSPTACSSSGKGGTHGLNVTPADARSRLPPRTGAKLQHRRAKLETQSSGWQAWGSTLSPSRFFSYGTFGRFVDSAAAMEAAITFIWDEHERLG